MARRILLHVGAPKTGTSAAQDVLFSHRDELAEQGILYPADRFDAHFLAALDLMQLPWGGLEREAVGRWGHLAAEARAWPGTVIISHEILGRASRQQAQRALTSLGADDPKVEVHLILTARDLARQVPAEWQENVKHRRTTSYADFLTNLQDPKRRAEIAQWFWGVQEVPDVLDRWGSELPPERVHVVTVPPSGAPRGLLWERLSGVLGLDPGQFPLSDERANVSLGVAESNVVRRLNQMVNAELSPAHYRQFVRELLVHRKLSPNASSARLALPTHVHEWTVAISKAWVREIERREYDVVGDLKDLLPAGDPPPYVDPDEPPAAEVADAAITALATSVVENARLRDVEIELHAVIKDLDEQLRRAHTAPAYKLRQKVYEASQKNDSLRAGLNAYREMRGKNSRST